MKKIAIIIFSALMLLGIQSCSKFLDIRPENETILDDYWQSESQATAVLASAYRSLTLDKNVQRMFIWGEVRSDNVVAGGSADGDLTLILDGKITPTNSFANWGFLYASINYCNTFLHYAPAVTNRDQNFSPLKLHALEAEARALRGLCYFYLVRTFKNVPLVTIPSINDNQDYFVGQSPERQVLDTIIQDLKFAQRYAQSDYTRGVYNKGRITKSAVNAILADVYLWDQQYDKCAEACDLVLADTSLVLVNGEKVISEVFYKGNSRESIFELQFDKDIQNSGAINSLIGQYGSNSGLLSYPLYLTRKGDYCPFNYKGASVVESENDIREFTSYGTSASGSGYGIYKYSVSDVKKSVTQTDTYLPQPRLTSDPVNWIVYRLSDVILMKAEALVELNRDKTDLDVALKLVNRTYLRSNENVDSLQSNNYSDQMNMEKLVLRERQRELLFEGKRWYDLLRLARRKNDPTALAYYLTSKISGNSLSKNKLSVMDALYMPVLKSEVDINSKLIQNPFYTDESLSNQ
jgi:starch-binding outer membrane protein, SusD/RagB family